MTISETVKLILWMQKKILIIIHRLPKRLERRLEREREMPKAVEWLNQNSITYDAYFGSLDAALWEEVVADCNIMRNESEKILSSLPGKMATGNYEALYFLVRKFKPKVVVETGVAAGCSTLSILRAFQKNSGEGRLFSSDLISRDYMGMGMGILARNEPNVDFWDLDITGDKKALPRIVKKLGDKKIDLFHYDSDKTSSGRQFCMDTLKDQFSDEAFVVFDDIKDNLHFKKLVEKFNLEHIVISGTSRANAIPYGGKGIIPNFGRQMRMR